MKRLTSNHWSIGTQTFWVMLGVSLLLVWAGATALSQFLHSNQVSQIREDIDKRTALFSTTLLDALLSEDVPVLETSLQGLIGIHDNLIGAEFCNYQNRPLLRWGSDIPGCNQQHPTQVQDDVRNGGQIVTAYREIQFEGERFGAIALRWDMTTPYQRLEQQIQNIVNLLVASALFLALVLFGLVRGMVVYPIRRIDHYLRQVESSESITKDAGSFSSRELAHLCEGVVALLQSMAAEAKLRDEREELLATLEEKVVERTQELRQSNDQLSSIMENMGDALFVLGAGDEILVANPAAEQLFSKLARAEGVQGVFIDLFPPELHTLLQQTLLSQQPCKESLLFSDDEQNKILLELAVYPLPEEQGILQRLVLLRDMTRQHDQEERERMIAFLSGAADVTTSMIHNIGNQLVDVNGKIYKVKDAQKAVVKMATFLIRLAGKIDQLPVENSKATLEQSGKVLQRLAETDLGESVSEIESATIKIAETVRQQEKKQPKTRQLSRFHPRSFLVECTAQQEGRLQQLGIEVRIEVEPGLNEVYLPRNELQLTIEALFDNAIEAIEATHRQDGLIIVRLYPQKHEEQQGFLLEIEDNGIGIESQQMDQLFISGYSNKGAEGHGLHSSANFIKSLAGQIELHSEGMDSGTTVEVWLPDQDTLLSSGLFEQATAEKYEGRAP